MAQASASLDDMCDQGFAGEVDEGFVPPHAPALPAGDDGEGEWLVASEVMLGAHPSRRSSSSLIRRSSLVMSAGMWFLTASQNSSCSIAQ